MEWTVQMKLLNYDETVHQIEELLQKKTEIVLATTDGKRVSARTVYFF